MKGHLPHLVVHRCHEVCHSLGVHRAHTQGPPSVGTNHPHLPINKKRPTTQSYLGSLRTNTMNGATTEPDHTTQYLEVVLLAGGRGVLRRHVHRPDLKGPLGTPPTYTQRITSTTKANHLVKIQALGLIDRDVDAESLQTCGAPHTFSRVALSLA